MHDLLHRSPLVARDVCTIRHPDQSPATLALDSSMCSSCRRTELSEAPSPRVPGARSASAMTG